MKNTPIIPGYTYHFFNNGNNDEFIFFEERNYTYFLDLLKKYLLPICDIYAYALLPKHFHFLLKVREAQNLPEKVMRKPYLPFSNFLNAYAKAINKAENRSGSLFSKHPYKILITSDEMFLDALVYIHVNAEKHGLVKHYIDYPKSSFHEYLRENKSFLEKNRVEKLLGDKNFLLFHEKQKKLILKKTT